MIDNKLSDKIKILSLICIILVLYIHSDFHNYPHEILGMKFNNIMQDIISGKIGRCVVPLFFMISGFLFFQNVENGINSIYVKMKKRIRTLVVPYIIACLFFPLFFFAVSIFPYTDQFINSDSLFSKDNSFLNILSSIFYKVPDGNMPLAFQLWFLRDLIIIVIFSPITFYLIKYLNRYILILFLYTLYVLFPESIFPSYGFFWFITGAIFFNKLSNLKSWILVIFYIIISILELIYNINLSNSYKIPVIFIGVTALISIYNISSKNDFKLNEYKYLSIACNTTFFIYLYHEPTLNIVRKLLVVIAGNSSFGFAVSYLLSPWIFAFFAIMIANACKKYIPKFYSVLVGGR